MANETTKMGLIPVRKVGGQSWTGGQQKYRIASGATTAIFQGDLVTQLTAGTIGRHTASGTVPILGAGARRAARRPLICAKRLSKARLRAKSYTNCVGLVHKSRVSARV